MFVCTLYFWFLFHPLPLIRYFDRMAATDVKKMPVKSVSGEDMILFTSQNHR